VKALPREWVPTIKLRPESNARQGFLDPPDLEAFLAELRQCDAVVADVTEAAYFTCLRRGNVLALRWSMIRPDVAKGRLVGGELRVPGSMTKNKTDLVLPLSSRLLDVFARRWRLRRARVPAGAPPWRSALEDRRAAGREARPDADVGCCPLRRRVA
jgi:integrase